MNAAQRIHTAFGVPDTILPQFDLGPTASLRFVHVPKTAGTSLRRYLDRFFLPQQVFPTELTGPEDKRLMRRLELNCLEQFRLIRGHHRLSQLQAFLACSSKYWHRVTVLRDPVSQLVSEYKMSQGDPSYPHHDRLKGRSLMEFLQARELPWIHRGDRQCAHLLVQRQRKRSLLAGSEAMDVLRDELSRYAFAGVHENLQACMQVVAYVFGWYCPPSVPHFNKSRVSDFVITPCEAERLDELTTYDQQLYRLVKDRFETQYRRLLQLAGQDEFAPDREVVTEFINREAVLRRRKRLESLTSVDYVEVANSEGFHLCHLDRHHLRQIAWIGPSPRATITVGFSRPRNYRIEIRILHWLSESMLDDFTAIVNGYPIPLQRGTCSELPGVQFSGEIPGHVVQHDCVSTEIVLETSSVASPSELNLNSNDSEVKCLAIYGLHLTPS